MSVGSFGISTDDAEAFKDEAQASKEVISVLRKEIDQLEMERETL